MAGPHTLGQKGENIMTEKQRKYVRHTVEGEGFDYTFRYYTEFKEVSDRTFHKLRKNYIKAANALDDYIGVVDDEDDED